MNFYHFPISILIITLKDMDAFKCFRGIQYFYALSGYNLNLTKNVYYKILIWIILSINLIFVNSSTVYESYRHSNVSKIQFGIVELQLSMNWIYYHSLIIKIGQIGLLIETLRVHISYSDIQRCYYLSFLPLSWTLISFPISVLTNGDTIHSVNEIRDYFGMPDKTVYNNLLYFIRMMEMSKMRWSVASDMIYLIAFYIMFRAKKNLLEKINVHFIRRKSLTSVIYEITDTINNIHNQFESTMSIFPFLTISYLFFAVSQVFYYSKNISGGVEVEVISWLIINISTKMLSALTLLLIIDYFNSKLQNIAHEACIEIRVDYNHRLDLINLTKQCTDKSVTGWRMFNLDLPLILSFLSSNVTFTILFLSE